MNPVLGLLDPDHVKTSLHYPNARAKIRIYLNQGGDPHEP